MDERNEVKNLKDRVDFVDAMNGGKQTSTKRALQIIFDNMQHNFDRIRDRQNSDTKDIQELKIQIQIIKNTLNRVGKVEDEVDHLKGEYEQHCTDEKASTTRVIKSAIGVGGLGVLLVILQLILIVSGG
jgi:hypothetical protein